MCVERQVAKEICGRDCHFQVFFFNPLVKRSFKGYGDLQKERGMLFDVLQKKRKIETCLGGGGKKMEKKIKAEIYFFKKNILLHMIFLVPSMNQKY